MLFAHSFNKCEGEPNGKGSTEMERTKTEVLRVKMSEREASTDVEMFINGLQMF